MARFGWLLLLVAPPAFADSRIDCSIEGACCFPRRAPRIPHAPEPQLASITTVDVVGSLARPAVKRVLGNRTAVLATCTDGKAEVVAHLVVAPSGVATVTRIVATPQIGRAADEKTLAICATGALHATVFPAASGVTELDVRIAW